MRINYKDFAKSYEESGLSRKDYGVKRGMSPSMVSYYLKRASESKVEDISAFNEIAIEPKKSVDRILKILTPGGLQIEIPL